MRIRGLAKLLTTLKLVCDVIGVFQAPVRRFVPSGRLAEYDAACGAIMAACTVIRTIEYEDDNEQTTFADDA